MDFSPPPTNQTCDRVRRAVRRRLGVVLGLRLCRRAARRSDRDVAAGAGAASLHLAGLCAASCRCRGRLRRSRRSGLAPRHCADAVRRTAARAVELCGLRVRAARPRQHHSTLVRRRRRTRSWRGSILKEALPPRRIAGAATIVLGLARDRRRGACAPWARTGFSAISCSLPPEAPLRFSACCCGCGGCRPCARRRSPACCRLPACRSCTSPTTIFSPRDFLKICCRRWCRACLPALPPSIFSPAPWSCSAPDGRRCIRRLCRRSRC